MAKNKKIIRTLKIFSRHPSHDCLRKKSGNSIKTKYRTIYRLGSTTESSAKIQINSAKSVRNSSNKLISKFRFNILSVPTPQWCPLKNVIFDDNFSSDYVYFFQDDLSKETIDIFISKGIKLSTYFDNVSKIKFPVVIKNIFGSRGTGNRLIKNIDEFINVTQKLRVNNYIVEKYHNYYKEYRIHCTKFKAFYCLRKMLKKENVGDWYKNSDNSVWILQTNPDFDQPSNWNDIIKSCCKAIESVGLDIGACDVIINKEGNFKILETNSAPSFGEKTEEEYRKILTEVIEKKEKILCV